MPPSEGGCEEGVGSGGAAVGPGFGGARNHSLPRMDRPAALANRATSSTVTPLWFCVLALDVSTWWDAQPPPPSESW